MPVIPKVLGSINRGLKFKSAWVKMGVPISKITKAKRAGCSSSGAPA
jgi:hypothetical protein